ncbi:MAG TPA: hypothetical protein VKY32_09125 [Flavobacterium sp.]|nr:hypothetical protein [Flavobacterium sp.]
MDSKLYSSTPFGIRKLIITINFFTFFSLLSFNAFAQNITLQINNASNHQPITNVRIITNDSILANTNEEGKVVLSKTVLQNHLVIFSALGYEDAQNNFLIRLQRVI